MVLTKKRKARLCKFFGLSRTPVLPFSLEIEPGNLCNLRCPLCPTGTGEKGAAKGLMSLKLFRHIFDQLKGYLETVNLYNWGEPLLNPELVDIIKYAKEASGRVRIVTSTNLNVKDEALLERLIDSGIDDIIVSCDGASRETYEKYRVGGDFDLVMKNIKFLARRNGELNKKTNIIWNFLVFRHNEHELDMARGRAKEIGVNLNLGLMRTALKDEILKPHKEAIERDKAWIPDNPKYSAYDKNKCAPRKLICTCRKPWQSIAVNWNGLVFPCCAVFEEKYNFGDASRDSIKSIWNNDKFVSARKQILKKDNPATTICGICRNNGFMHM
jgi:radical SAM protein with 4Fe4S-binding SPASM domain